MRRVAVLAVLMLAACGSDSKEAAETTERLEVTATDTPATDAPATTDEPATTEAPTTTEEPTTSTAPKHQLHIRFTLIDSDLFRSGTECHGTGGYDDFGLGMNISVHDGDGKVIGAGRLDRYPTDMPDYPDVTCTILGQVDVKDADFYVVTIGSRGDQTYTAQDMEDSDWKLDLSLGG